jgi:hypothetical protein
MAANRTTMVAARKAAREDRIHSYYEFATHRIEVKMETCIRTKNQPGRIAA